MSFLAALRTGTADCHAELEKSLDLLNRVKTPADYRDLLLRFYTIYLPLERVLAAAVDWPARSWDFGGRLKTPWLEQDLRALGLVASDLETAVRCEPPVFLGWGSAVGALYVLEGSTLGGQFLTQRFQAQLGVTPATGGQFFAGYGAATMPRWKEFGGWADRNAAEAAGAWNEPGLRGARETFDAFARWLT